MKAINRTNRLERGRSIGGGKSQLYAGEPGGLRKIRCTKCHGIASPTRSGNGTQIMKCTSCGASFQSTPLVAASRAPRPAAGAR